MATLMDQDYLRKMIDAQIAAEVQAAVAELTEKACEDLRKAIQAKVAAVTLKVLAHYEVERSGTRLIIEVKQ